MSFIRSVTKALLITACLASSGCAWLLHLETPNDDAFSKASKKFNLPAATKELAYCMKSPQSQCKSTGAADVSPHAGPLNTSFDVTWVSRPASGDVQPANIGAAVAASNKAIAVLNHPVQAQINKLFNIANGLSKADVASGTATIELSIQQVEEYVSLMEDATSSNSWTALSDAADVSSAVPVEKKKQLQFIKAYLAAYFRNGSFYRFTVDATNVQKKLTEKLIANAPILSEDDAKAIAKDIFEKSGFQDGQVSVGTISDSGFVSRGGQQFKFPAFQTTLSLPEGKLEKPDLDYLLVGTDLVRVFLHALFDATLGVPAVPESTGVGQGMTTFKPVASGSPGVTAGEFGKIETRANQVEAVSAAGIGRLIRGAGFLALNNEALASIVETIIGVSLRKPAEKLLWCWYQCGQDALTSNGADYLASDPVESSEVTVNVTGRAKTTALTGTATNK
jgi:hypothetical protein